MCEGFVGQAAATGRGMGFDRLPLVSLPGHVDAQGIEELIANVEASIDRLIRALTVEEGSDDQIGADPGAVDIVVSGTLDEIQARFLSEGWSDGLPVVPPTRERVERFLAVHGHDPFRRVGVAKSSGRDITVWSVAVNAVMAGCSAEHMPVLLAAAQILADPHYGAEHSGNTTGADALMILNGPSAAEWGFNSGQGLMRSTLR